MYFESDISSGRPALAFKLPINPLTPSLNNAVSLLEDISGLEVDNEASDRTNCKDCSETVLCESNLGHHIASTHAVQTDLNLKCKICDYTAYEESDLKSHVDTLHMKIQVRLKKQHIRKCPKCDYILHMCLKYCTEHS